MEKKLNSFASTFQSSFSLLPSRYTSSSSSSKKSSFSFGSSNSNVYSSKPVVVELQTKYFPIQPRGGNNFGRDLRNAGIIPATMANDSSSSGASSTTSSTIPVGKLKEPRDLYSTATLLHPVKWPVECQVIPEKIRHVEATPNKLEPFYTPTGKEPQPQPVGVEMGTVVYDYQPKLSVDYFCRATVGGSDLEECDTVHNGTEPTALKFESRFESGNLAKAIKVTNMYYELYLRPDLYTDRHAQWFYFRIQNTKDNVQYRFSIVNFNKPDSLYRYGLKILMYSEKEAQLNNVGWTRCGQNITYFKNDISPDENGPYYTLTFNLKFKHNNDTVYLAQCYPYTYSSLQNYLKSIEEDEFKSQLLTIRLLCRSIAGNNVHVLTVTSPENQQASYSTSTSAGQSTIAAQQTAAQIINSASMTGNIEEEPIISNSNANNSSNKKPVIVISARVHPGETQSSYMMKGIIDFLTSDCAQAKELRDRFIFKLIPMLNPDGVVVGNTRCCLLGQDLNRQYRTVLREAFPQIYHAKVMIRRLQEENGIFLYCDLHGHSRRHNVFIYGCENRRMPERKLVEQVFPLMMHKNAADKFSFQNCKFKIQKNKEGTGRVFVWTLGVVNSYTLEISLGGSTMPSRPYTHFNTSDYEACGRHFCETLLDYSDPNPLKEHLRDRILQKLVDEGSTADEPKNVVLSDYSSLSHSETDGEDEDDDNDREDSSPDCENGDMSKTIPLSTGSKSSSSGVSSASNSTLTTAPATPKKQLKRQNSIGKHRLPLHRTKSAGRSHPPKFSTISAENSQRSPLPIHRGSVDFTKIKQRKIDDSSNLFLMVPPTTPTEDIPPGSDIPRNETPEMSPAFRRLTKFRRKAKKNHGASLLISSENGALDQRPRFQSTAKCTRILFDDPFNPPGTTLQKLYTRHRRSPTTRNTLDVLDINCTGWQSGSEDECDPEDNFASIRRLPTVMTGGAPIIKITDCSGGGAMTLASSSSVNEELYSLAGDMSRLKVSNKNRQFHRSSSDSESQSHNLAPVFAPFVPSFPVGKAFLHQTFYPDKSTSPVRSERKDLTGSLSDMTMTVNNDVAKATLQATAASTMPFSSAAPTFKPSYTTGRRGSIGYLVGNGTLQKGKPQGTGSMSTLGGVMRDTPLSSTRRVSWTGTLTVSVPTVPPILRSPSTSQQFSQSRKSFRKSKSLSQDHQQSQQQHRQSSTDMTDSTQSLVGSISLDKIATTSGGMMTGNVSKGKQFVNYPSCSQSTGSLVAASSAKKKRGKLKRSKNK